MKRRSDYRWEDRPNGEDESKYQLARWSKKRAMWEFLRRHKQYQKVCNEVFIETHGDVTGVSPLDHDNSIPLDVFVDYPCNWEEACTHLKIVSRKSRLVTRDFPIHGESIREFWIDLEAVRKRKSSLEVALTQIRRDVEKELEIMVNQTQRKVESPRYHPDTMGRALRYLDLKASPTRLEGIGKIMYPQRESDERSKMLNKDVNLARRINRRGIRDLMNAVFLDPEAVLADLKPTRNQLPR